MPQKAGNPIKNPHAYTVKNVYKHVDNVDKLLT